MTKVCTVCKIDKPLSEFWLDTRNKTGRRAACALCAGVYRKKWKASHGHLHDYKWKIKKRYNLNYNDYLVLLKTQENKCAICGTDTLTRRLDVDHCHETGKVRGLLCAICNRSLGGFKDNTVYLSKAIEYLNVEKTSSVG